MKYNIMKYISLFAIIAMPLQAHAGATLDRVTQKKEIVVATNSAWKPQSYFDDNNQLIGFDIDVAKEIARRLDVKLSFQTPEFAVLSNGRWNGRYDLGVGSVTPTKARAKVVDFVGVYYYSPYVYAVPKNSKAEKPEDLNGKIIGVETGTTSEDFINHRLDIDAENLPPVEYKVTAGEIRTYANSLLPFDDLRLGDGVRLNAVIAPEQTARNAMANKYPIRILEGEYAFKEPLVIIAEKGDKEWNDKIASILDDMRKDGTLKDITVKWYGKDYSQD